MFPWHFCYRLNKLNDASLMLYILKCFVFSILIKIVIITECNNFQTYYWDPPGHLLRPPIVTQAPKF